MTKSEACAIHDGIKKEYLGGRAIYLVPCAKCGTIMQKRQYDSSKEYLCGYCKLSLERKKKTKEQMELDKIRTPREQAFDKAVKKIEGQVKDFERYSKAIKVAEKRAENYGSIPEAMVAIELLKLGYKIIPQQKIGSYKVDFAIPEEKMIIEVDGGTYHPNGINGKREATIQMSLGIEWNIIHIPADWVSKHISRLKEMIDSYMLRQQVKK